MEILKTMLWIIQIISAISIVILVLLQQGKGADAGATFGASGSSSLFGASGSANFLSRSTAIGAVIFFVTTLALVVVSSRGRVGDLGVMAHFNKTQSKSSIMAGSSLPVRQTSSPVKGTSQIPD